MVDKVNWNGNCQSLSCKKLHNLALQLTFVVYNPLLSAMAISGIFMKL